MKKRMTGILILTVLLATAGCQAAEPTELSNDYITVKNFHGVKIEKVDVKETTDENVDTIIDMMMSNYVEQHDLPEDTEISDEIVKEISDSSETVDEYRDELYNQIAKTKKESALEEEETRVWEKVMDNTEVKKYPKDRLKEVKQDLVELYEGYAEQNQMTYDEYMDTIELTDEDLDEAAEASLKQELVADLLAQTFALKPSDDEVEQEAEEYAEEYNFSSVDLLYQVISEDDVRNMLTQDKVKEWLHDRCEYIASDSKSNEKSNEEKESVSTEK